MKTAEKVGLWALKISGTVAIPLVTVVAFAIVAGWSLPFQSKES